MGGLLPDNLKIYDSDIPTHIDANNWTLFDKITYGGLGYGVFNLPSNFFIIILTCVFPPLGQIIHILGNTILPDYPFFTWDCLKIIFKPSPDVYTTSNFMKIIYSFILTSMFYIPGLTYVLENIANFDNVTTNTT